MVEYLILLELSRKNRQGYQYNHYYSRDYDYESSNNYDDSINHSSETSNNNEVTNHKSHLKVKKTSNKCLDYCCPYCGSINIRTTKNATPSTNYKSHLKVKKTSNKCLDYCYNCYTYIPKGKEYCPNCGSINIQRK